MKKIFVSISLLLSLNIIAQNTTAFNSPPEWSKSVIWYQLFVERFCNGDQNNDPVIDNAPKGWKITPWTQSWYKQDDWEKRLGKPFNETVQQRRYGGDLQGILNKLDYLQELGITALFINPINDAPSLHKYDARNYHHIDVNFGPDPIGDNKLIASENPADSATWKWTSADKLFLKLIDEVHKRGMKIIVDYSWNHTGTSFWAWIDLIKNQEKSTYKDWYEIESFDNSVTPENEFKYKGWAGVTDLPELKKVNITTQRISGLPYEGDINEGAKKHIFAVAKRWLAPNGDTTKGIDGYRLDVADQIGIGFWRDFRRLVRSVQPNAYLVGEIWWENFPDRLMNPAPYIKGDVFDAVMFYQAYRPARYFFAKSDFAINAQQFKDSLLFQWNRLPIDNQYAMMNVSSSHDSPRLLTDFNNTNKYKYVADSVASVNYKSGKPTEETYERLHLYLVHLFTTVGCPNIFNGEEMGMWGADDPNNRKPLWWKELQFEPETRMKTMLHHTETDAIGFNESQYNWFKKLIKIRKDNPVLSLGNISFLKTEGNKLVYKRWDNQQEILVLFNMENSIEKFSLPYNTAYTDLITNQVIKGTLVEMKPLSAMILKKL